ncbi:Asp-tRNA(Asn)/Glu-tRNA(Gln) amidotransferase subunit GatB [Candidatus Endowatersipora endosymbiont of Watersipora subatra]|uniref:Asp-tRNA(Asn)/Glu-tRNA(Gln) amidotransferase subunit GatB n=1 Tax=Candidatus Endowatersipora endosymbiont of Watersipora subatra TaxID=3077946 RepID=UPI00312C7BF3
MNITDNRISNLESEWEIVIGLEVHAQVKSESKLFSGSSTQFGNEPNTNVSLIDAAMPGMLPVINAECVRQAVRTGLAFKARINNRSVFERKNYFYPDLPQGYQITQFNNPIVGEGIIPIQVGPNRQGKFKTVNIGLKQIHLEQDAGKLIHDYQAKMSLVDLNRSGIALMEIVSNPDIRSIDEAKSYVLKLRSILRYLGACDGNMEQGSMRTDANISVRKPGRKFGTKCEIKNLNSIRFMSQAIEYEARRQISILEDGGTVHQETRLFDPARSETRSMRSKEEAHDYRYFPEPDLLPLKLDDSFVEILRSTLPELPDEKWKRFVSQGVSEYDASILVSEKAIADFYESLSYNRNVKICANWVINDLIGALNKAGLYIDNSPISENQLGSIIDLIENGIISRKIGKDLFEIIWNEGGDPKTIVESRSLAQVTDVKIIESIIDDIMVINPDKIEEVRKKPNLIAWFVGQVMKRTRGKANPKMVNELLRKKLL